MIDLYYWPTPNGHKITMFLEEAELIRPDLHRLATARTGIAIATDHNEPSSVPLAAQIAAL